MRILITLVCLVLFNSYSTGQTNIVNVNFEIDGRPFSYKNAFVEFLYNKDTVRVDIKDDKLPIPDQVFRQKVVTIFYFDKYVLNFDTIPVTLNMSSPRWVIGLDKKPFNKEKYAAVKSWKKVQIIYYLKNDDGRMFTVDGMKRSQVIK